MQALCDQAPTNDGDVDYDAAAAFATTLWHSPHRVAYAAEFFRSLGMVVHVGTRFVAVAAALMLHGFPAFLLPTGGIGPRYSRHELEDVQAFIEAESNHTSAEVLDFARQCARDGNDSPRRWAITMLRRLDELIKVLPRMGEEGESLIPDINLLHRQLHVAASGRVAYRGRFNRMVRQRLEAEEGDQGVQEVD